jgi:RNA polymerase primary sigma factor
VAVFEKRELVEIARDLLFGLEPRYRQILELLYGLGDEEQKTLREVAELLWCSEKYVRNMRRRALRRLRHPYRSKKLLGYLED